MTNARTLGLLGRRRESETLDRLLATVRAGQSAVLVIRGEAGVGKSALLAHLVERASDFHVARAAGVESEMELPFAGLHQLCGPMLDRLDRLTPPQRDALATALGMTAGDPPDRFFVGLAVLSLLSEVSEERPLLCVVDDAHWLDRASAQTLPFVARRLLAEAVGLVFAVRDPNPTQDLAGLPELVVGGLDQGDASALLHAAIAGRLDERIGDRILAEARGNPLALLELPRGLTSAQIAGGFGLPGVVPLATRIEQSFRQQLESLPAATRRLLLVAAAEPIGDLSLLLRAAGRLGLGLDAAAPAEAAGLIELGTRVRFRHPLLRSTAYRAATVSERRTAHQALAEAIDPDADPDRRAWHRAHAAVAPDEAVAGELERSASRAQGRGGIAAAAAFMERATTLTADPARRVARALAAAEAKLAAGAFEPARILVAAAEAGPVDDLQGVRIELLRAQIAFASSRGNEAAPLLLAAARRLEALDVALARDTYLEAISAAMFAGRLARGPGAREVAQAARRAPSSDESRKADTLLDGLTILFTEGYARAAPIGAQVLQAFGDDDLSVQEGLRWLWLASAVAADLWDHESWHVLSTRYLKLAREAGALSELPLALNSRAMAHNFAGELAAAARLVQEADAVTDATGIDIAPYGALGLAAWRGRHDEAQQLIEATMSGVQSRGEGIGVTIAHWATALLANGLGHYEEALSAAQQASQYPHELAAANWGLVELIEAAARTNMIELAASALEQLSEMTQVSGTDWALGVACRSRALLSDGDAAEQLYREAIERLSRASVVGELARAHLLYGEWLRRADRRIDARQQLHSAHDLLTAMGAEGFAERARRELAATGETVRKRTADTRDRLTGQELQIARMAADGLTNSAIGAQLFISPRTVEYHLRKVFTKLSISSRRELRAALPEEPAALTAS
jgi:DNA-binding CsgD family transcriptional regulator